MRNIKEFRFTRKVLCENGSAVTAFIMLVPMITIATFMMINVFCYLKAISVAKIAAKKAAFVGAAVYAHEFNEIAKNNWRMHNDYLELAEQFGTGSQNTDSAAKQNVEQYKNKVSLLLRDSDNTNKEMFAKACAHATEVILSNFNVNIIKNVYFTDSVVGEGYLSWSTNLKDDQTREMNFQYIEGSNVFDPSGYDGDSDEVLTYLARPKLPDGLFVAIINYKFNWPFLPHIMGVYSGEKNPLNVEIKQYAQSFGGSLEKFAMTEAENLESALIRGNRYLYKPVLLGDTYE